LIEKALILFCFLLKMFCCSNCSDISCLLNHTRYIC